MDETRTVERAWGEPTTDLAALVAASEAGVPMQIRRQVPAWERAYAQHLESIKGSLAKGYEFRLFSAAPAPAVCADPLPEGVHAAPDGTLLAIHENVPAGWEIYYQHNPGGWRWTDRDEIRGDGVFRHVRPVPAPSTVQVPWHDAVRNSRTVVCHDEQTFVATTAFFDCRGSFCIGTDAHDSDINVAVPPSGTVACLPLPGEDG